MLAIAALVLALCGTLCIAIAWHYGGPLLYVGGILIGIATVILSMQAAGFVGGNEAGFLPLLGA